MTGQMLRKLTKTGVLFCIVLLQVDSIRTCYLIHMEQTRDDGNQENNNHMPAKKHSIYNKK